MFEKETEAPDADDSIWEGCPELVAHGPRETPGEDGLEVVG